MRTLLPMLLMLAGCAQEVPAREAVASLRVGIAGALTEPSPFEKDGIGAGAQELVFRSLIRIDRPGAPEGDLAERWSWSSDGQRLTIKLRSGVRFADNTPLVARDVVDTYKRATDEHLQGMDEILGLHAVDDLTIELQVAHPFLLPSGVVTGVARSGAPGLVGAGPYLVSQHDADGCVLRRNPLYSGALQRPERIEFHRFDTVAETWSRLLGKEIDLALYVPWNKYEIFRSVASIRRVSSLSRLVTLIELPSPEPPFDQPAVRRALSLAVDRKALIDAAVRGHGRAAAGIVWPEAEEFDGQTTADAYDPQGALRLLAAHNIVPDSDGNLTWKGAPLRLKLAFWRDHVEFQELALTLERQLGEIGIHVDLVGLGAPELVELLKHPGPSAILRFRHAASDVLGDDETRRLRGHTATHPATADLLRQEVRAVQQRMREEMPSIYLYWPERLAIIDAAYCGLPRLPDGPESALQLVHPCAPGETE